MQNKSDSRSAVVYVHGSKESRLETGTELGLKGKALDYFKHALPEVACKLKVNVETGAAEPVYFEYNGVKFYPDHVEEVRWFMAQAGQPLPEKPTIPPPEVRIHRAKLTFEEAVREKIMEGFGINIEVRGFSGLLHGVLSPKGGYRFEFVIADDREPDLLKIVDGIADTQVVNTGDALACGIDPRPIQQEVDANNLKKFGARKCPEHGEMYFNKQWECTQCDYKVQGGYLNEHGKWVKPSDHKPPEIERLLKEQGAELPESNGEAKTG